MRLPLLALLILAAILHVGPAFGQSTIHHCVSSSGTPIFTDQPCASMHSTPVAGSIADSPAGSNAGSATLLRKGFAAHRCAANLQVLKQRIVAAFAAHDANALAGLMVWAGYGYRAARADLDMLQDLVDEPLMAVDDGFSDREAAIASDAMRFPMDDFNDPPATKRPAPAGDPVALVLHLGGVGDDTHLNPRFAVTRVADCLWLSP